jgi:hypothetical protein
MRVSTPARMNRTCAFTPIPSTNNRRAAEGTEAFLALIDTRDDVARPSTHDVMLSKIVADKASPISLATDSAPGFFARGETSRPA